MSDWRVLIGDVLDKLGEIPDESVQCVVTSPPYWGLRDYGVDGMIGLEPTLSEHLSKMVEVFREVRRVLRPDGTLWLNYGDAYQTSPPGNKPGQHASSTLTNPERQCASAGHAMRGRKKRTGLAPKQRLLLPHRVAMALQDDGWWVRSEIVWAKGVSFCPTYSGSCMPSSVRDRPTDSHEFVFLLTKAPRYFYDGDAVREAHAPKTLTHRGGGGMAGKAGNQDALGMVASGNWGASGGVRRPDPAGRNLRTVWTINPQAYSEAHFATYPERLVEPCLKAGTSERGACSECGAPWRRVVVASGGSIGKAWHEHADDMGVGAGQKGDRGTKDYRRETTGWEPTCDHPDADTRPCLVLDPFNGSGTTGAVAVRLGLDYVGIELNPEYAALAHKRIGRSAADVGAGGDVSMDEDPKRAQRGLFQ